MRALILSLSSVLLIVPACAAREGKDPSVRVSGIPHVLQKPDFCGEACAAMALAKLGASWTQDDVFNASGTDPALGRGCRTRELETALRRAGVNTGTIWRTAGPSHADEDMQRLWTAAYDDLKAGVPSIVCMRTSDSADATEHFRLLVGYRRHGDLVLYHEPAEQGGAYRSMPRDEFLRLWPLKYNRDAWTVVRLAMRPANLAEPPSVEGFSPAEYAQHVRRLRGRLPDGDWHVRIEAPFVVAGNESADRVAQRARRTVRWAVTLLKKDYFTKDPRDILDVLLFRDKRSYEAGVNAMFGCSPGTPFGYYSPSNKALVMNIATGGGTLVHEIVHPFMEANFPNCPAWFNEGLGSLFEQCAEQDGHIRGLVNWRLSGLQKALRAGDIPSFDEMCHTTSSQFYDGERGDNYAQARYLCMYLQEQGLLRRFYRRFLKHREKDPSGYASLMTVLDAKSDEDMAAFRKRWERWVLGLSFR